MYFRLLHHVPLLLHIQMSIFLIIVQQILLVTIAASSFTSSIFQFVILNGGA